MSARVCVCVLLPCRRRTRPYRGRWRCLWLIPDQSSLHSGEHTPASLTEVFPHIPDGAQGDAGMCSHTHTAHTRLLCMSALRSRRTWRWLRLSPPAKKSTDASSRDNRYPESLADTSMQTGRHGGTLVATATDSLLRFFYQPQFLILNCGATRPRNGFFFSSSFFFTFRAESPDSPTAAFHNLYTPPGSEANHPWAAAHLGRPCPGSMIVKQRNVDRLLRHKHTHTHTAAAVFKWISSVHILYTDLI